MKLKTKIFGLIISITGLLLSILALAAFCYLSITLFQSIVSNKDSGFKELITFLLVLIPLVVIIIITIIMVLITVYYIFFLIMVIKACKGGRLKVVRKIGMAISITFILISAGVLIWMLLNKIDDYMIYIFPFVYFISSLCQIIFYNAHKKETTLPNN